MSCLERKEKSGRMERSYIRFLHSLLLSLSDSVGHFFGSPWFTLVHLGSLWFTLVHFASFCFILLASPSVGHSRRESAR